MKRLLVAFSIVISVNVSLAAPKHKVEKITPEKVLQEINTVGPQRTLTRLTSASGKSDWNFIRKKIEAGNADWLPVAGALSKGINDYKTGQDLRITLSLALTKNAAGVLHLINSNPIDISYLCSAPFASRGSSFVTSYSSNTVRALQKVREPGLQQAAQQCIAKLQQAVAVDKALKQRPAPDKESTPLVTEPNNPPETKLPGQKEPAPLD